MMMNFTSKTRFSSSFVNKSFRLTITFVLFRAIIIPALAMRKHDFIHQAKFHRLIHFPSIDFIEHYDVNYKILMHMMKIINDEMHPFNGGQMF